jgi:hypothetical protein
VGFLVQADAVLVDHAVAQLGGPVHDGPTTM